MSLDYVLAPEAEADLDALLLWSQTHFGAAVREGYEELLRAAFTDVSDDPERAGSHERPELGDRIRSRHLALSRDRANPSVRRIASPRHFVIYRHDGDAATILRILHDAMDLPRHRPGIAGR